MKRILLSIFALAFFTTLLIAEENKPNLETASFSWERTTFDFGKIQQGKPVTISFPFTNSSKVPLLITNVKPACGCTGAEYTKEKIEPGKSGFVKITYNAAGVGNFNKTLTVTANTNPSDIVLSFTGEVITDTINAPITEKKSN